MKNINIQRVFISEDVIRFSLLSMRDFKGTKVVFIKTSVLTFILVLILERILFSNYVHVVGILRNNNHHVPRMTSSSAVHRGEGVSLQEGF